MSDKKRLLGLAERCEKATGPDRGLDGEIDAAANNRRVWNTGMTVPAGEGDYYEVPETLTGTQVQRLEQVVEKGVALSDHQGGDWVKGPNGRVVIKNPRRRYALKYTASLDAAMTLVPEGCPIGITADPARGAVVYVNCGNRSEAATPALALTAAALRARAAMVGEPS